MDHLQIIKEVYNTLLRSLQRHADTIDYDNKYDEENLQKPSMRSMNSVINIRGFENLQSKATNRKI